MNITINNRIVGPGYPTYIVAEMSANHNKSFENAVRIIEAAREAGADAVKIQTYTPETLTIDCDNKYFKIKDTIWRGKTLYQLYEEAYMPWEWQPKLKSAADSIGIDLFSTAFDIKSVDFLLELNVPTFKISSFEITDSQLLKKVASTRKPIILSTGMSTLFEINEAIQTITDKGTKQFALLKCTSAYPAEFEEMNILTIPNMMKTFNVPIGFSDHTIGSSVAVASVTLGACIVEKHFTLSRSISSPDSKFSMEPKEFQNMVKDIRNIEKALGEVYYGPTKNEKNSLVFRKSIFVVKDISAGEKFSKDNLRVIRPGYGLHSRHLNEIIGCKAKYNLRKGTPLEWSMVE